MKVAMILALVSLTLGAGAGWLRVMILEQKRNYVIQRAQESKQALEDARRILKLPPR